MEIKNGGRVTRNWHATRHGHKIVLTKLEKHDLIPSCRCCFGSALAAIVLYGDIGLLHFIQKRVRLLSGLVLQGGL